MGTGVGVIWQGKYLIATAKHVIEDTPPERIYYFLPQDSLQIEESSASIDWTRCKWPVRQSLENPRVLYSMEQTMFRSYESRLKLDDGFMRMRREFEALKEHLREGLKARYRLKPPRGIYTLRPTIYRL